MGLQEPVVYDDMFLVVFFILIVIVLIVIALAIREMRLLYKIDEDETALDLVYKDNVVRKNRHMYITVPLSSSTQSSAQRKGCLSCPRNSSCVFVVRYLQLYPDHTIDSLRKERLCFKKPEEV